MKEIEDLEDKVVEIRELVKVINTEINYLEGQGCKVKVQVNDPYNKIDFVLVDKTFNL